MIWRRYMLPLLLLSSGCGVHIGPGDRAWNQLVAPARKSVALDSYRMHYIDVGRGPVVVLVHGFADSSYSFHETARPLLAAGYRLIILDLPGLGRSGIPPESYVYSVENQAAQVLRLTRKLGLERFHLVGHSMGGGIALYLAWKHRRRLRSVVLLAPASFEPGGGVAALARIPVHRLVEPFFGRWVFKTGLLDVYHDDAQVDDVLVDEYARLGRKRGFVRVLMRMLADYFSPRYHEMTRQYGGYRTPMLIVWGEEDKWLPCWRGSQLHGKVPGSVYVRIPEAGHNVHQERAAVVTPFVLKFLQIHSGR